jgi:ABC-type multidrug transport system fused ATPase/permease subunit
VGAVLLVGSLNIWAFIPAISTACAMLFIRHRFASCLRDLKRIEGLTRSPVYSQLTSTIHGLKVIRSYHAENISAKEFFFNLDQNTRAAYLLLVTNRWAAIRFDWTALSLSLSQSYLLLHV